MSGYKLLLIPEEMIYLQTEADRVAGKARIIAVFLGRPGGIIGPFEVIADVPENGAIRMSRLLYETIEVVDVP